MSYNRTSGKGGTVNASRDAALPDFSKSTYSGSKTPRRIGDARRWPNRTVARGERGSGSGQNNTD